MVIFIKKIFLQLHYPSKANGSPSPLTSDLVISPQGHQMTSATPASVHPHSKDSDSGCSADMSAPNVWNIGQSSNQRDHRSSQC